MSNNQPIQFLLHQLATNEQDQTRFNLFTLHLSVQGDKANHLLFKISSWEKDLFFYKKFEELNTINQQAVIRTCLSRVNGEAVLGVFEGFYYLFEDFEFCSKHDYKETDENNYTVFYSEIPEMGWKAKNGEEHQHIVSKAKLNNLLYSSFDFPLRNGKPIDEALQALHDKMLELVPEYQELLKNNK